MKKRVLIAVHIGTFFNELLRVGEMLQASDGYEPLFLFPHFYATLARDVSVCQKAGFTCLGANGQALVSNKGAQFHVFLPESRNKNRIKNLLVRSHLIRPVEWLLRLSNLNERPFNNFFFELWYLNHRISLIRRVIKKYAIGLIVLGGDTIHYDTACFIQAAHRENIRAVVVPCTMSNAEEMAESYSPIHTYHLNTWLKRLIAQRYPKWVYVHRGRPLIRLPASRILALEMLHLAPPRPWIALSGFSDAIATESEFMVDYYTRDGIPRAQLEVTGTLGDDLIYDNLNHKDKRRASLLADLGLQAKSRLVVSAVPPDQLYMEGGRPECEFPSYRELLDAWVNTLADLPDSNVVLSLHPSMLIDQYRFLERPNVRISAQPIPSLIPLADVFVASISTVIRWAIACGIPVVNYDVYRLRYSDYSGVAGVLTLETMEDFKKTIQHLIEDETALMRVRSDQLSAAARWGRIDGQAHSRILELFNRLTRDTINNGYTSQTKIGHVIFIAYINSHLPQLIKIARALSSLPGFRGTLLFVNNVQPLNESFFRQCRQSGLAIIDRNGDPINASKTAPARHASEQASRSGWLTHMSRLIGKIPPLEHGYAQLKNLLSVPREINRLRRAVRQSRQVLQNLKSSLLVLPEENTLYETFLFTKPAQEMNIPSLITPYTIANATEFAESYKNTSYLQVRGFVNPIIARLFPHWAYQYGKRRLLLMSWPRIIATQLLRLAPPDPWMFNSGFANTIAVESTHMLRYYEDNGIPSKRLSLTGSVSDDVMAHIMQNRKRFLYNLQSEFSLDPDKPIVLCALPPPWFPRPECEFASYQDLLRFWIKTLIQARQYSIIVNPHPRIDLQDIEWMPQSGAHISRRDIAELIPLCDIFVASVSATIRWAIACGVPVLNYDVYQWGFHDYDDAPGVLTVKQRDDFTSTYRRLTQEPDFKSEVANGQALVMKEWGMLDGHSQERLHSLAISLITQNSR